MALAIKTVGETNLHAWERTVELGKRHGLTLYDSTYLELALCLRLPLASLDKQLRRAASAEKSSCCKHIEGLACRMTPAARIAAAAPTRS